MRLPGSSQDKYHDHRLSSASGLVISSLNSRQVDLAAVSREAGDLPRSRFTFWRK